MTTPRRSLLEEGRRKLDEAAGALDGLRRLTGEPSTSGEPVASARDNARRMAAEKEARIAAESDSARRVAELVRQVVILKERVTLLSAEHVRLETLRRKAEAFGTDSEASRKSLEETLRRDLLAAHAALDRAAAESGIRDARAITEIEELRKRLDEALARFQELERRLS